MKYKFHEMTIINNDHQKMSMKTNVKMSTSNDEINLKQKVTQLTSFQP